MCSRRTYPDDVFKAAMANAQSLCGVAGGAQDFLSHIVEQQGQLLEQVMSRIDGLESVQKPRQAEDSDSLRAKVLGLQREIMELKLAAARPTPAPKAAEAAPDKSSTPGATPGVERLARSAPLLQRSPSQRHRLDASLEENLRQLHGTQWRFGHDAQPDERVAINCICSMLGALPQLADRLHAMEATVEALAEQSTPGEGKRGPRCKGKPEGGGAGGGAGSGGGPNHFRAVIKRDVQDAKLRLDAAAADIAALQARMALLEGSDDPAPDAAQEPGQGLISCGVGWADAPPGPPGGLQWEGPSPDAARVEVPEEEGHSLEEGAAEVNSQEPPEVSVAEASDGDRGAARGTSDSGESGMTGADAEGFIMVADK